MLLSGAFRLKAIDAVIFESRHHLAIGSETEFIVARSVCQLLRGSGAAEATATIKAAAAVILICFSTIYLFEF